MAALRQPHMPGCASRVPSENVARWIGPASIPTLGLRAGDPDAIRKVRASRDATHLESVLAQLDTWLPTVRRLVSEGIVEATLRDRAPRQQGDDRLIRLVAGIAAQLEAMRERRSRGGTRWHPSSVKHLLARAEKLGLAGAPPARVDPGVWR
jgi:hypothetical protein